MIAQKIRAGARLAGAAALMWIVADVCRHIGAVRSTAAMMLVLAVLAMATLGDRVLALVTSASASLAFSWYFVDAVNSLRITTLQGGISFAAMTLTALTGAQLSIRAQRRATEAERRREEMERLHQFGSVLLSAGTVAEAAENAVRKLVELFGLEGAALRIEGDGRVVQSGITTGGAMVIPLNAQFRRDVLELFGRQPSGEVGKALASMISLVLERARSAEEQAKIEAMQRGEELRSTVLNALAHNFKTPLTSIKLAASALRSSARSQSVEGLELIVAIDEEVDRLAQLIRESLDLAQIEGHRANPRVEECLIGQIIHQVTSRVSRYMGRREFVLEVPDDLPPICGDKFLLEQMLIQVVDNAWKYSRPGSRIRLSAETRGNELLLTVRNEGSEIPECERALIFDRFYRGTGDRSRIEGTGLGLAIAKTIAEAYQGKVWLEMEQHGPAFRFALPLEATGKKSDNKPYDFAHRR